MIFADLKTVLANSNISELIIAIKSDRFLEPHFHVTEVGKVTKDFVDCGGVRRKVDACVLQTLVANDVDHRLAPSKLLGILEKSDVLEMDDNTEVEIEIQGDSVETYSIGQSTVTGPTLTLHLQAKQTACLAPDKCGLQIVSTGPQSCCGEGGC